MHYQKWIKVETYLLLATSLASGLGLGKALKSKKCTRVIFNRLKTLEEEWVKFRIIYYHHTLLIKTRVIVMLMQSEKGNISHEPYFRQCTRIKILLKSFSKIYSHRRWRSTVVTDIFHFYHHYCMPRSFSYIDFYTTFTLKQRVAQKMNNCVWNFIYTGNAFDSLWEVSLTSLTNISIYRLKLEVVLIPDSFFFYYQYYGLLICLLLILDYDLSYQSKVKTKIIIWYHMF